jgi:hypothetical protein
MAERYKELIRNLLNVNFYKNEKFDIFALNHP